MYGVGGVSVSTNHHFSFGFIKVVMNIPAVRCSDINSCSDCSHVDSHLNWIIRHVSVHMHQMTL